MRYNNINYLPSESEQIIQPQIIKNSVGPWHNNDVENAIRQEKLQRKVGAAVEHGRVHNHSDALCKYRASLKKGINFNELVLRSIVSYWVIARILQTVVLKKLNCYESF